MARWLLISATLASPYLLALSFSPSSTLLNQLLAVMAWGLVLCVQPAQQASTVRAVFWPLLVLAGLALASVVSWYWMGLPASIALSGSLLLLCAGLVLYAAASSDADGTQGGDMFWLGLLLAGVLSALIAILQVFWPDGADGNFIARSGLPGRAVGNVRQPNHLSTLLLWALMALVPLAQRGQLLGWRVPGRVWLVLGGLMTFGVVLTASRTGVLGVLMLAVWGLLDKRLPKPIRQALFAVPVAYLLLWLGMAAWSHLTRATFGGEARLAEGDLSSSRFGVWSNAWELVLAHPWLGVGMGNFNYAWTLTPFPGRPVAFFDHTHNLPLQFAVELGLPVASVLLGALLWALWQAWRRSLAQEDAQAGTAGRAAAMIVMLAGVHSLLEYPLWYGYFLLPTAWAFGLALREPHSLAWRFDHAQQEPTKPSGWPLWQPVLGMAMVLGALLAAVDYQRVVVIYQPGNSTLSLEERIARGQSSALFAHHADYAAATTTEPPSLAKQALARTTHSLLDTRLMTTWAQALAETGHVDQARYVAARLREFRNPASVEFFATCDESKAPPDTPTPYQCEEPTQNWHWQDFLNQP